MCKKLSCLASFVLVLSISAHTYADWSDDFSEDPPVIVATGRNNAALNQDSAAGIYTVENGANVAAFGWVPEGYIAMVDDNNNPRGFGYLVEAGPNPGQIAPGTYEFTANMTWEADSHATLVDVYVLSGSWAVGFRGGPAESSEEGIHSVIAPTDEAALAMKVGSVFLPDGTASTEESPVDITIPNVVVTEGSKVLMFCYFIALGEDGLRVNSMALESAGPKTLASAPLPKNGSADVVHDVELTWKPGETAASHDVYVGTSFDGVNDGAAGTLVSQGQSETTYDAGVLAFDQTYFWRVDEVSGAPDRTVFKGDVWSFTVEPTAIPIGTPIIATASGSNPGMEPSKTIDGSGLNELGQHSVVGLEMWLTITADSWIQYEFDQAYKLYDMHVWNSNQVVETFIGFGVKDVVIETSLDGETWTVVDGVGPFAQATAQATYEANTTVDLSDITAKFVKITPQSAYGFTGQSGLSEVRFSRIPTQARELQPADGSITDSTDVMLSWRAGREAASHQINLGTDPDNLALAGTTDEPSFMAEDLDYDQTYYWQIVEVNEAETSATYASDIQSFNTPAYGTVDDFESYSGDEGEEVFMTWFDGYGGDASLGGSTTGHIDAPFVETTTVYDGGQSMPFFYDNDGGFFDIDGNSSAPTFSEVLREFDSPQDWTTSGVQSLSLMFSGTPGNTGQLYCKIGNTKILYDGDGAMIGLTAWSAWNIDLSTIGGNLASVRELAIGVEGGGSGVLYIDSIRLYPKMAELVIPIDPGNANLAGQWNFDEGAGAVAADSSGHGNDGLVFNGFWATGKLGSALSLSDATHVEIPARAWASVDTQVTVAFWNYADATPPNNFIFGAWISDDSQSRVASAHQPFNGQVFFDTSGDTGGGYDRINKSIEDREYLGAWHHWAFVKNSDTGQQAIYLDGSLWHSSDTLTKSMKVAEVTVFHIGASPTLTNYYLGLIDDFHLYNKVLSQEEILWLAGITDAIHDPF